MKGFARRILPPGGFARSVATLAGATAFSQIVSLAALPVLTRLYGPGEYGPAAVYAGIVGLIVVIATFRYEFAIPLPRSDRGALHLVVVSLAALGFVALITGLASPFIVRGMGQHTGLPDWAFTVLVVVGTLAAGVYNITNYWAVRRSKFGEIARTRIQQGLASTGSQLALGFFGLGALGLILGQIVGLCAGVVRLASGMISDNRKTGAHVHRRGLAWAAKRYRQFPLFDSWAGLLNVAGAQAPVLMLAALFSPIQAGYYALAYKILSAPMGLVGKAVSQALLPRIIEAGRHGDAGPLVLRLLNLLAMLSLVPFAAVAVVATDLVPIAFGAEWAKAADVIIWTTVWVGWQFICSPLSVILIGIEAQRLNAVLQFMLLAMRVSALLVGAMLGSAEIAIAAFSVASLIGYAGYTLATGIAVGLSLKRMAVAVWQPVLLAGGCFAIAVAMPADMLVARYALAALLVGLWLWSCWGVAKSHILTSG